MANPTEQQIRDFVTAHCEVWMTQDKAAHTKLWKDFAPNGITFEDPVGTTPKKGWDQWSDMWDRFNAVTLDLRAEYVYVCGNEAAMLLYHKIAAGDEVVEIRDIETWKFDNGTADVRCWWEPPADADYAATLSDYSVAGDR